MLWRILCFGKSGANSYCSSEGIPQQLKEEEALLFRLASGWHRLGPFCQKVGARVRVGTLKKKSSTPELPRYQPSLRSMLEEDSQLKVDSVCLL